MHWVVGIDPTERVSERITWIVRCQPEQRDPSMLLDKYGSARHTHLLQRDRRILRSGGLDHAPADQPGDLLLGNTVLRENLN